MSIGPLTSHPCIKRCSGNPLLTAAQIPYPSDLVFNPGVIPWQDGYAMIFRNDHGYLGGASFEGTDLGLALSRDGLKWEVEPRPVFSLKDEEIRRVYDPRLTVLEDQVIMTFAVDTRHGLRGGIARTRDLHHFDILSMTVPDNRNIVLFPEKIGGKYVRLERPMPVYSRGRDRFDMWLSDSPDLVYWGNSKLVAGVEDFPYANDKIGPGAPPVKTDRGWLVITHSVDRDNTRGKNGWEPKWPKRYSAGMLLLDLEDPSKVLGICREPLLAPETDYEVKNGFRTNAIFATGAVLVGDTLRIYYGAADTVIALAEAKIGDLVDACLAGGPR